MSNAWRSFRLVHHEQWRTKCQNCAEALSRNRNETNFWFVKQLKFAIAVQVAALWFVVRSERSLRRAITIYHADPTKHACAALGGAVSYIGREGGEFRNCLFWNIDVRVLLLSLCFLEVVLLCFYLLIINSLSSKRHIPNPPPPLSHTRE